MAAVEAKVQLEVVYQAKRDQARVQGAQASDLVRSWLFSTIVDSEKCRRYAQNSNQALI
jgi:hypothetical protein